MQINFPKPHKLDLTANSFLMASTQIDTAHLPYLFNSIVGYEGSKRHYGSCLSNLKDAYYISRLH